MKKILLLDFAILFSGQSLADFRQWVISDITSRFLHIRKTKYVCLYTFAYKQPYKELSSFINLQKKTIMLLQGFIPKKIGSENGPFIKIGDLRTDPSQKSEILKWTIKVKIIM